MTPTKRPAALDVSTAARLLGRRGGLAKSANKAKAAAANGRKGGRPRTRKAAR